MKSIVDIHVGTSDIDIMNHVNNTVIVKYLEYGRTDFYQKAGFSINDFLNREIGRTIVNLKINYHKEILVGENLLVHTYPIDYGRSSIRFRQEVHNSKDEKICDAVVTAVIFDLRERRSIPIPEELLRHIKACLGTEP